MGCHSLTLPTLSPSDGAVVRTLCGAVHVQREDPGHQEEPLALHTVPQDHRSQTQLRHAHIEDARCVHCLILLGFCFLLYIYIYIYYMICAV